MTDEQRVQEVVGSIAEILFYRLSDRDDDETWEEMGESVRAPFLKAAREIYAVELKASVETEREECAKMCEAQAERDRDFSRSTSDEIQSVRLDIKALAYEEVARAIRARGGA